MVRTKGELRALNRGPIDSEEMVRLLVPMMDERNQRIFRENGRCRLLLFLHGGRDDVAVSGQRAHPVG